MTPPPQLLRIKRKRDDEPVEALYLEAQPDSPKRRHTENAYVFRRLQQEATPLRSLTPTRLSHTTAPPTTQQATPGIPRIITTQPGDELRRQQPPTSRAQVSRTQTEPAGIDTTPRRFHLSRSAIPNLSPTTGKRKAADSNIAVLVESRRTPTKPSPLGPGSARHGIEPETHDVGPARKRPNTKSRRIVQTTSSDVTTTTVQMEESMYEAMQRYASEFETSSPRPINSHGAVQDEDDDVDMADTGSDDGFVYDTYIRQPTAEAPTPKTVGFIVITEADQTLWETYYDSDAHSSDENDWDSEQDDENAENYYGADYPEGEVSDSDEYDFGAGANGGGDGRGGGGRGGAYRYHDGSEGEEFGSSDGSDGDDEDEDGEEGPRGVLNPVWMD